MTGFIVTLLVVVAIAFVLWRNKARLKGIRSNITGIGGSALTFAGLLLPQLEAFPWRQYLPDQAALYAALGTLALVTLFSVLKGTSQ
jgi:hypothetical protein